MQRLDGLFWTNEAPKRVVSAAKFIDRFGEPVNMLVDGGDGMLGFPRTWAPPTLVADFRTQGHLIPPKAPPEPRNEKQADILDDLQHAIVSCTIYNGQIVAPTGFGKTWVGCHLIHMVPRTTLIVTTKTDEMNNWKKHCKAMLGIEAQEWHGDVIPDPDCKIAVGLVQSIAKGPERYSKELYDHFGMVIFDECHRLGADFFVQACHHLPALWRFGMSATPDRSDGREKVIEAHLGPIIAEQEGVPMVPKVFTVQSGFRLPFWRGRPAEPTLGKLSWVDKKMRVDKGRNDKILSIISKCYEQDRNTVIFSNVKAHLEELAEQCLVPTKDIGWYIGGRTIESLEMAATQKTIFATYQMGGQGTNYPWWDACILTTPLAGIKQPIGRVLREYPDKRQPVIFDILDPGRIWGGYAQKRLKVYREYGAEVVTLNI